MALEKAESEELAKGIASVARHYDVSASAKSVDIANLIMIVGMIYGPRIFAYRTRKSAARKRKEAENAPGQNVFQFAGIGE